LSSRIALKVLAGLAAACVLAVAGVAFLGVGIDAGRWREPAAAALSRSLGREVRLEGPARLTLSLRPELVVRELRIANPPGFASPDFARIAELRLGLALLPLLRDEIRLREVRGRDVTLRLARAGDGRGNWAFGRAAQGEPARPARLAGIDRLVLENVGIEYAGPGEPIRFDFAGITAEAPPGGPLRLAARGRADAFSVQAAGARLSELGSADPWPFELQLFAPGLVLNANGALSGPLDRPVVRVAFGAGTPDLAGIGRVFGVAAPAGGGAVAGALEASPGRAALTSINAVIAGTPVAGELALDTGGARPRLTGRLATAALDLRARPARAPGAGNAADTLAAAFDELERAGLDLRRLSLADADLRLSVAHWAGLPGDVRELDLRVRIDAGKLAAPVAATVGGARFDGALAVDGTAAPPHLSARLAARDAPLGGLAELVFDVPYVAGTVRRFEAALDASGSRAGELARDLQARIAIEGADFTYGNYPGAKPVAMRLDAAEVAQPRGRTIAGKLRGSLRGKPFAGTFRAGTVERLLRERRTPFDFAGTSGGVRARLSGTLAEPSGAAGPEIAFEVTAAQARELAPWLGFSSGSEARVAAKGNVRIRPQLVSLADASLLVGRTSLAGTLTWRPLGDKALVTADLAAEVLAPAELRDVAAPTTATQRATLFEIPILPESLDFADTDLAVRVKRVDGLRLEITDAVFTGRMRGGELAASPFSLSVEGNALAGAAAFDARGAVPAAQLWLAGRDVDVGPLLRRLRVARDVDSRIGAVRLYADVRERRLGDALERSSLVGEIESGTLDFRDANTRARLRIAVGAGAVRADAGAPVTASLTGTVGDAPVTLKARTGSLRELAEPGARLPFSLAAETPAAKLAIDGTAVPERSPDVALAFSLTGERLDGLDWLLEASVPPWGPYALTGRLRFAQRGYTVDALRLALGESVATGRGALDTTAAPPRFDVALAAERIRLDDFPLRDWSPFEARTGAPVTVDTARAAVREGARRTHAILSQELLGRVEGGFDLAVKRAFAGADELGGVRLRGRVERGRATIGPLEIEGTAGGRAAGTLVYEPRERDVVVAAELKVDRFDYGRAVRALRRDSDLDGAFSLDLALDATAPRLSAALASGSGHFDFAVWPKRMTGGGFDLWTANLLFRLLPIIDVSASPLNCVVGHFDLAGGRLESRRIVIDTVNTRTEGSGSADFATEALRLRFVPRPKVPQFFSLATPVEVAGTFDDYAFGLRTADVLATAVRWAASPIVVPIQRLAGPRIPPDGSDVCVSPAR
jgi:hypothetical protein